MILNEEKEIMISLFLTPASAPAAIRAAVRVLTQGGVIALPTETTYGLACDPRNMSAVRTIFRIKGRRDTKPLQLIAGSLAQVKRLSSIAGPTRQITDRYWPGPLTLLLPLRKGKKLAAPVRPKNIIGIRVTSHALVQKLALAFGHPIAATSANKSGESPCYSGRRVREVFAKGLKPALLLDAGPLPRRAPSTVARIMPDGSVKILRAGSMRLPRQIV